MTRLQRKNLAIVAGLGGILAMMITLVSFSVPLYRLFCAATGFAGTARALSDTAQVSPRMVTIHFDTQVAPGLDWDFAPVQNSVQVHLGEEKLVFFTAKNLTDHAVVAHAAFNVTPVKAAVYFNKIQCFCFSDERLAPGESVQMPVDFFVDPAIAQDPAAASVDTITLSYTFFPAADPTDVQDLARFDPNAPPDPKRGEALFAERCSGCHTLDKNGAGPLLGGVMGRRAGSVAGYHYSPALQQAGLTWDKDTLDHWLANPRGFVAGAKMPVRVLDETTRRDLIAYLAEAKGKPVASAQADR